MSPSEYATIRIVVRRVLIGLALLAPGCQDDGPSQTPPEGSTSGGTNGTDPGTTTDEQADSSEGGDTTDGGSDPGDPVMLTCPKDPAGHDPLELVGTAEGGGASQFMAVVATEEHAFGCAEQGGLVVWSLADPAAPAMVHGPSGDSCTALGLERSGR